MLRKFLGDRRGNLALTSALALVPMMAAVAAAVDYSQISRHTARLQQALDASALATGKKLGTLQTDDALSDYSEKFFFANIGNLVTSNVTFTYDDSNDSDGAAILLKASYVYPMYFGGFLDMDTYTLDVESLVKAGNDTVEIALVLDNSGSMRNTRIATAISASSSLVTQIHASMAGSNHSEPVKFALIPFAGHVNVGTSNDDASWMDTTGISPIHHENLNWPENPIAIDQGDGTWKDSAGEWLTRFTLFDDMSGVSWKGCVESRPYPYFTTDEAASISTPKTMFVPVFAPDEPDSYDGEDEQTYEEVTSGETTTDGLYCKKRHPTKEKCKKWNDNYKPGSTPGYHSTGVAPELDWAYYGTNKKRLIYSDGSPYGGWESEGTTSGGTTTTEVVEGDEIDEEYYYNNYLDDDNNMPSGMLARHPDNSGSGAKQNKRQDWTWKYKNQSSGTSDTWKGPNAGCTTDAITPLTTSESTMINAIEEMEADGSTNIPLGISWGWRALSNGAPFTEGRTTGTADNIKIMIVMTDGNNTYYTPPDLDYYSSNYNKSTYGSYGYTKSTTVYSGGRLFEEYGAENNPDHDRTAFQAAMDEHMLEICTNAKNDGIRIYTVAFEVSNGSSVKTMLEACASTNSSTGEPQYFDADSSEELLSAFNAIGNDISNLRLAQ